MLASPSERLRLVEAPNFRDLGGRPVGNGRQVRPGRLFRSEGLNTLTDADVQVLSGAGIRLVCDLRTVAERELYPSRLPADRAPAVMVADPESEAQDANPETTMRALESGDARAGVEGYMFALYRSFPRTLASTTIALLDRIIDGEVPVLVHCAAGKDRTGFVCSLILHALGASDDTVMAEYMETDSHYGGPRMQQALDERLGREAPPGMADAYRAAPQYHEAAFAALGEQYASVDDYLDRRIGLTAERRRRLAELLTEPR